MPGQCLPIKTIRQPHRIPQEVLYTRNLGSAAVSSVGNQFQEKAIVLPLQACGHLVISTEFYAETTASTFRGILCVCRYREWQGADQCDYTVLWYQTEPCGAQEKPELCLNEAVVIFSASKTSLSSQVPHSSFVSLIEQVHHKLEFLEITKAMDQLHSMTAWFLASWFSTVPVRLYWNWKQFSLRRQGRTCESSAHVLELSDGLSRWRVLLCVVCGSHDCENQRAGRVIKDPMFVDKFYVLICIHGDTCTAATGQRLLRV